MADTSVSTPVDTTHQSTIEIVCLGLDRGQRAHIISPTMAGGKEPTSREASAVSEAATGVSAEQVEAASAVTEGPSAASGGPGGMPKAAKRAKQKKAGTAKSVNTVIQRPLLAAAPGGSKQNKSKSRICCNLCSKPRILDGAHIILRGSWIASHRGGRCAGGVGIYIDCSTGGIIRKTVSVCPDHHRTYDKNYWTFALPKDLLDAMIQHEQKDWHERTQILRDFGLEGPRTMYYTVAEADGRQVVFMVLDHMKMTKESNSPPEWVEIRKLSLELYRLLSRNIKEEIKAEKGKAKVHSNDDGSKAGEGQSNQETNTCHEPTQQASSSRKKGDRHDNSVDDVDRLGENVDEALDDTDEPVATPDALHVKTTGVEKGKARAHSDNPDDMEEGGGETGQLGEARAESPASNWGGIFADDPKPMPSELESNMLRD
ncbi:hypothetical protein FRB90_009917 [Tulasnella sp. 427]|nr:hypothetical protein FRB90_009917 [Tulasnella sp. 427]